MEFLFDIELIIVPNWKLYDLVLQVQNINAATDIRSAMTRLMV